jgi:hypothetical protein
MGGTFIILRAAEVADVANPISKTSFATVRVAVTCKKVSGLADVRGVNDLKERRKYAQSQLCRLPLFLSTSYG